jgi:hypothetical protein
VSRERCGRQEAVQGYREVCGRWPEPVRFASLSLLF